MDPTVVSQLQAGWGAHIQKMALNSEQDNRVLGGVLTRMLIQGGDPANYADLNAGVRMPTTIEHPTYWPPSTSAMGPTVNKA